MNNQFNPNSQYALLAGSLYIYEVIESSDTEFMLFNQHLSAPLCVSAKNVKLLPKAAHNFLSKETK